MTLEVRCPTCGQRVHVARTLAGKAVKCPRCRAPMRVPMPAEPASAAVVASVPSAPATVSAGPGTPAGPARYVTPRFVAGLVLGVLAVLACTASAILPWTHVPPAPGSSVLEGIGTLIPGLQAGATAAEAGPSTTAWPFAVLVLAPAIAGMVLPRDRLRGAVLLGAAVAGSAAWFVVVARLRRDLDAFSPLARYVSNPEAWPDPAAPPSLAIGVWLMAGAIALMWAAGATNFCRRPKDALVPIGLGASVALLGTLHLNDWLRSAEPNVQLAVHVERVDAPPGEAGVPASKAEAVIALTNHSRRPVVVVPALVVREKPAPVPARPEPATPLIADLGIPGLSQSDLEQLSERLGLRELDDLGLPELENLKVPDLSQTTVPELLQLVREQLEGKPPGQGARDADARRSADASEAEPPEEASPIESSEADWFRRYGEPDGILCLEREQAPAASTGAPVAVPLTFGEQAERGAVVGPGETVTIAARFAPVWRPGDVAERSMAGPWQARLRGADRQIVASAGFEVPGAAHPVANRLLKALDRADEAVAAWSDASPSPADLVHNLKTFHDAILNARAAKDELGRLRCEPSAETARRFERLALDIAPTVELLTGFFDKLDGDRAFEAMAILEKIDGASPSEAVQRIVEMLPGLIVELARSHAEQGRHRNALVLLASRPGWIEKAGFESRAGKLLEAATVETVETEGACLVGPDGGFGRRASPRSPAPDSARTPRGIRLAEEPETPRLGQVLQSAVELAESWRPGAAGRPELRYSGLVGGQLAGADVGREVRALADDHPDFHADEIACWLGMKALEGRWYAEAEQQFAKAAAGAEGPYVALAELGLALAKWGLADDDLVSRVAAEHPILTLRETRTWADDVTRLTPPMLCPSLADASWIERITRIATPEELDAWNASDGKTIAWVQPEGDEAAEQLVGPTRQIALGGGMVLVNYPLFAKLARLRSPRLSPDLLRGVAAPVRQWGKKSLDYSFLRDLQSVPYDATASRGLVPVKGALAEGDAIEGLLYEPGKQWLIAAARIYRTRDATGAIVFVPDRFGATPDANRFVGRLVEDGPTRFGAERVAP